MFSGGEKGGHCSDGIRSCMYILRHGLIIVISGGEDYQLNKAIR